MALDMSTALSGISAAHEWLRASASNAAKLASGNNAQRAQADQSGLAGSGASTDSSQASKPVVAANETAEDQSATYSFVANLRVLQTQIRGEGTMLDVHA